MTRIERIILFILMTILVKMALLCTKVDMFGGILKEHSQKYLKTISTHQQYKNICLYPLDLCSLYKSCSVIRLHPKHLECLFILWELFQILLCEHLLNILLIGRIYEGNTSALEACTRETATIDTWQLTHNLIDSNEFW